MSIAIMTAAWAAPGLSHTSKIVLLALADNANDAGVCWPSIPKVAERCSLDQRSVYRAIAMLEGAGHVEAESRPGKPTIYRVHPKTPDTLSPLTDSHPCQPVTPDTQSQTHDSLSVPPPFTPSRALPPNPPPSVRQESSVKSRAPKRARSRTVPEDFQVTEAMREWAKAKAPNVDLEAETEKFRDHEFRDPHSDWPAAWRQWIRRAPEFGSRNPAAVKVTRESADAAELQRLREGRIDMGLENFRDPFPHESAAAYRTALNTERNQRGTPLGVPRFASDLAAAKRMPR